MTTNFCFCHQLVCIIVTTEEGVAAFKDYVPTPEDDQLVGSKAAPAAPPPPAAAPPSHPPVDPAVSVPTSATPPPPTAPATAGARVFASPYAKTLAAEKGIDLKVGNGVCVLLLLFLLKGGQGCRMSFPCLESQGCHLIPLCYPLSCFSA